MSRQLPQNQVPLLPSSQSNSQQKRKNKMPLAGVFLLTVMTGLLCAVIGLGIAIVFPNEIRATLGLKESITSLPNNQPEVVIPIASPTAEVINSNIDVTLPPPPTVQIAQDIPTSFLPIPTITLPPPPLDYLVINGKNNGLFPQNGGKEMIVDKGTYEVTLDSRLNRNGVHINKVIIYATTNQDAYGWFWVVEEGKATILQLSGDGKLADRVYAFIPAMRPSQVTGQATVTFTGAGNTKMLSVGAENVINPVVQSAQMNLPEGRYELSLNANIFFYRNTLPIKKVLIYSAVENGQFWILDDHSPLIIDLATAYGYSGILYGYILDVATDDNSGESIVSVTQK